MTDAYKQTHCWSIYYCHVLFVFLVFLLLHLTTTMSSLDSDPPIYNGNSGSLYIDSNPDLDTNSLTPSRRVRKGTSRESRKKISSRVQDTMWACKILNHNEYLNHCILLNSPGPESMLQYSHCISRRDGSPEIVSHQIYSISIIFLIKNIVSL